MQQILVSALLFGGTILLAWPLGKYMNRVYTDHHPPGSIRGNIENRLFKFAGIDPQAEMNLWQYLCAFLLLNMLWLVYGTAVLLAQGVLPLNPDGNPSMEFTLALHSAISFITSANLQHYSGETGATYFSQLAVFSFLQFVSASASLAVGVAVVRSLRKQGARLGNFYVDFIRSGFHVLLPLCLIVSVFFLMRGIPMTFSAEQPVQTLEGATVKVATGPVASMIPIKELGSNGGGFYGTNDAHPFENPDLITYIIHYLIVLLMPMAFLFFTGFYLNNRRFAWMVFAVMFAGFWLVTLPVVWQEQMANPAVAGMGIDASAGNMEGKETRFGSFLSALYSGENACIPAGTITGMHDSFMPLSGLLMMVGMQIDGFFGGLGTGWINLFLYMIVAVFLASLMIGRTPELLGRKVGTGEVQLAVIASVLQLAIPMSLTAIASYIYTVQGDGLAWLSNPGAHGLSTMHYEFVSASAGNGSGFEGLGDNTPFWNLSTSVAMLTGRFVPMIAALCIGWRLCQKKAVNSSAGTLKTESVTFGIFLFLTVIVLNALSSFPIFALGPLSEYFAL